MRLLFYSWAILFVFLVSPSATTASVQQDQFKTYTLCKNDKIVRTIRIEKDNGHWVTYYTKQGVDREVARAQHYGSCQKVAENIKENLTKANWKCKDLENVTATSSSDN